MLRSVRCAAAAASQEAGSRFAAPTLSILRVVLKFKHEMRLRLQRG